MIKLYYNELIRCTKAKIRTLRSQIRIVRELKRVHNESYCDSIKIDYMNCLKIEYNENVKHLELINEWIRNTTKSLLKELA